MMAEKRGWLSCGALALLVIAGGQYLLSEAVTVQAAPAVWRDHATGFAIGGYDPVAYHTQRRPVRGRNGLEHQWGGAAWRFFNSGNRDAFAKHPEIYVPRFAGYDAFALSRGLTLQGEPLLWVFYKGRLLLFQNRKNLKLWKRNPDAVTKRASINWKKLGKDLPGTSGR
ncbi:MAG: hypothetical protein MPJ78_14720 [Hyphomicrobiaceae bacterium]|nr:hypothetical protein [Hyphomicrobiaceae bacterium]